MTNLFTKGKWLFLAIIACFSLSDIALAQRKRSTILKYDAKHRDGKVLLTDGTELSGGIAFNDNEGIITLVDGTDSKAFNSRDVLKFEFYSDELGRYRVFYSLEYNDPETGVKDAEFFEVLKELSSFAVLVRIERLKTQVRSGLSSPYLSGTPASTTMTNGNSTKITQTQTVFFMNERGDMEPYLRFTEKELQGNVLDWNEKHSQYINADLFKKYTGEHFKQLVEYARANKLSFKRKADITTILDKYEDLIEH